MFFVITYSIDFGSGTPVITALMLAGTVFLLLWEYRKLGVLFYPDHEVKLDLTHQPVDVLMTDPLWVITGAVFIVLTGCLWALKFHFLIWVSLMIATGLFAFVAGLIRHFRRKDIFAD